MIETDHHTDFISYWDNVSRQWAESGEIPCTERFWFEEQRHLKLHTQLMPEPYWGDIDCSSVVFLNMNPAGAAEERPEDTCHHANRADKSTVCGLMANDYSAIASKFPISEGEFPIDYDGIKWWRRRVEWAKHFGIHSERRPFAIELCAWHSRKWTGGKYNRKMYPEIYRYISEIFAPALRRAIRDAETHLILCVGSEFARSVLPLVWPEIEDVTTETIGDISPVEDNARQFQVFRIPREGHVVCTSAQGSNGLPSEKVFGNLENLIYNKTRNI